MAMGRLPGPPDQGVKGKKENLPFWPGGLQLEESVDWIKKRRLEPQKPTTDGEEKAWLLVNDVCK